MATMPRQRFTDSAGALAKGYSDFRTQFDAAQNNRFRKLLTGTPALGSGADFHYRSDADFLRMMELGRHFDRNDPIVGPALGRLVDNIYLNGFCLQFKTGDKDLDRILLEHTDGWAGDPFRCDVSRRFKLQDMGRIGCRQRFAEGDHFNILTGGRVQAAEMHRCRTPRQALSRFFTRMQTRLGISKPVDTRIVHGILLDDFRAPVEYWFTEDDINPNQVVDFIDDMRAFPAVDSNGRPVVLHRFDPRRVSQTRGVTALAPIADYVGMFGEIQFATLVKQQAAACLTFAHEQQLGGDPLTNRANGTEETTSPAGDDQLWERVYPGMIVRGQPGETIKAFSPAIPTSEFLEHSMMVLSIIAVNLNIPVHCLLLDASHTNFSGFRGAKDESEISIVNQQQREVESFLRPAVRHYLTDNLFSPRGAEYDRELLKVVNKAGYTPDTVPFVWKLPKRKYIEPHKDSLAASHRMNTMQASPSKIASEQGEDWQTRVDETVSDISYAIVEAKKQAQEINQKHDDGDPVGWRELLRIPTADMVSASVELQREIDREPEQPNRGAA